MLLSLSLLLLIAFAQEKTVQLDSIEVTGSPISKFATGSDYTEVTLDDGGLELDDVLKQQPSIYFKTYGNDQLATISFRGTSASHTNVLWHGLPANSITLGQTDFSLWPVWMMSSVAIQPGSSGALYGSGSIGGTVFVDNFRALSTKPETKLLVSVGSFGAVKTGIRSGYGMGRMRAETVIYRSRIENDFDYPLKGTDQRQTQKNAAVLRYGAKQTLQYQGKHHRFSLDGMFNFNDREIQPPVSANGGSDKLKTFSFRMALEHLFERDINTFTTTVGYLHDRVIFNQSSDTRSHQLSILHHYQRSISRKFLFLAGTLLNFGQASSQNYDGRPEVVQADIFGTLKWTPLLSFSLSASVREAIVNGVPAPFSPSLGLEWHVPGTNSLVIQSKVSKGFRFPTLNDRNWIPGGNRDLVSEQSSEWEAGITYGSGGEDSNWSLSFSGYRIWSKNWIIWLPNDEGVWSPDNIQRVEVTGVTGTLSHNLTTPKGKVTNRLVVDYTRSLNQTDFISSQFVGNQLPYVPLISANWQLLIRQGGWGMEVNPSYTGDRFTTLDNDTDQRVDAFLVTDISVDYEADWWERQWKFRLRAKNIFDDYYENLQNRAMPGRNYQLELVLKL